jgi:hypothetical protein
MNKIKSILASALIVMSGQTLAASISIGPYLIETEAAATSAAFTGSVFENVSGAITDNLANTYIKGTSVDAAVDLNFGNIALSNQSGDDLALFFITATNNVSLDINGTNKAYTSSQLFVNPADPFVDIGEKYLVENVLLADGTLGIFDLSVIFIDLNDFGIGLEQSINNITVNIGNSTSFMTYAAGLNPPVVVPLPGAFVLLLSGLAGLSLLRRRK